MTAWTDEEDEALRQLLGEGATFTQAGALLGKSKNACISRSRRIGVKSVHPCGWQKQDKPKALESAGFYLQTRWTPRKVEKLREMRAEGVSVNDIAVELHSTINAVNAAARRHKVPASNPVRQKHLSKPIAPVEQDNAPSAAGLTLMELGPRNCRWPINEPMDRASYVFCGADKPADCPYCAEHRALAWRPNVKSKPFYGVSA